MKVIRTLKPKTTIMTAQSKPRAPQPTPETQEADAPSVAQPRRADEGVDERQDEPADGPGDDDLVPDE